MSFSIIIVLISFILEGIISKYIPMNTVLFESFFTVISLIIIYPYFHNEEKKYFTLAFFTGLFYDIVYKYNYSSEYHFFPKVINFLKKIIKAEVVTQFPNLAGKVSSDSKDGFQGAVEIRRVTPNKELRRNEKYWRIIIFFSFFNLFFCFGNIIL